MCSLIRDMAPANPHPIPPESAEQAARRVAAESGSLIHAARMQRRWSLRRLGNEALMSASAIHRIEAGHVASLDSYTRLGHALGLRIEIDFVDLRQMRHGPARQADVVHAAMGELEARHLGGLGFTTGIDEPYQHFQFAGRADVVAWDPHAAALLHIENRTRFTDIQEAAGAWNGKRQYLPAELAKRLGVRRWNSVTNVMVGLWSREVLDVVRQHRATFGALCPDDMSSFENWWKGEPPRAGTFATFVVLDPCAARKKQVTSLDAALGSRPRHRGYADVARNLRAA
jgi:transcriptional regulator with XRE-family HTH domain